MSRIVFAIPGDIDAPTGGYGYDRRLLREWCEARNLQVHVTVSDESAYAATFCVVDRICPGDPA